METVLRAAVVYAFIWLIFRLAGRRTFSEMTSFDLILLLIVAEAVQEALLGQDFSFTGAAVVVVTLVGLDVALAGLKRGRPGVDRIVDGLPVVLVEHGRPLHDRMKREHVDESDILEEARSTRGLMRMDQIKYAVLERNGGISIIPMRPEDA